MLASTQSPLHTHTDTHLKTPLWFWLPAQKVGFKKLLRGQKEERESLARCEERQSGGNNRCSQDTGIHFLFVESGCLCLQVYLSSFPHVLFHVLHANISAFIHNSLSKRLLASCPVHCPQHHWHCSISASNCHKTTQIQIFCSSLSIVHFFKMIHTVFLFSQNTFFKNPFAILMSSRKCKVL